MNKLALVIFVVLAVGTYFYREQENMIVYPSEVDTPTLINDSLVLPYEGYTLLTKGQKIAYLKISPTKRMGVIEYWFKVFDASTGRLKELGEGSGTINTTLLSEKKLAFTPDFEINFMMEHIIFRDTFEYYNYSKELPDEEFLVK